MNSPTPPLSRRDLLQTLGVVGLWALCYPLINVAVRDAPALTIAAFRASVAGAVVLAIAVSQRRPWPARREIGLLALAGLGLTTTGFAGMFLAGGRVGPGLATVLSNSQPLMAAGLAVAFLGEAIRGRQATAMAAGFSGIVVASLPSLLHAGGANSRAGVAFVMLGAAGVAVGNVLLKHLSDRVDPVVAAGWTLAVGSLPLWAIAAVVDGVTPLRITSNLAVSVVVLTLAGTALPTLLWFDLLKRNDLVRLNVFTFLGPVLALAIGAVFFGERLGTTEWVGAALILIATLIAASRMPEIARNRDRNAD